MKADIRDIIKKRRLYFDGGTGSCLQDICTRLGVPPELLNIKAPDEIVRLHRRYLSAGCNIIKTNTFGINRYKYANYKELIAAALGCARTATDGSEDAYIALDIGPLGRLLKPLGDLDFEDAVSIFADNIRAAQGLGADLILIETMNDSYETKAAVIAAKENSDLPIFVTNVYDEGGKLMTGASPEAMTALLEGLSVSALGMNCSLGPDKMLPLIDRFTACTSLPIIVNPNAGLPCVIDGKTVYNTDADTFASLMAEMAKKGACILGGCCGTTPEYIKKTVEMTADIPYVLPEKKSATVVSSYTHAVTIGGKPTLIGERINPTGKKKLKEALREKDMGYIQNEAVSQEEAGAHILDVNVGLPEIDEAEMMRSAVLAVQSVSDLPLQLDSNQSAVLEGAMRIYNGKPLINSVNGDEDCMRAIFPLVKKYGGAVVALAMDEKGIPKTAKGRADIICRIIDVASEYGIDKKDIIADPLALTVSSDSKSAAVTLEALRLISDMGINTVLGVSNISFGLPMRDKINSTFFAMALENGLSCAIMNPFSQSMLDVYYSFCALHGLDVACADYIAYASASEDSASAPSQLKEQEKPTLHRAIVKGIKKEAVSISETLIKAVAPLDIINSQIIPALNEVGADFEANKIFLPQLLMSAEAACAAFDTLKGAMSKEEGGNAKQSVILATVKGDIHDIGKNIVKVLLESYGFEVYDLGRDVSAQSILDCAIEKNCSLVALSALMTTTVPAMADTIKLLHDSKRGIKVMVGGAVLNAEYAKMINADFYGSDAMEAVRIALEFYK